MKNFELKNWMSENREVVISKYSDLTNAKFFSGISLKSFMIEILNAMVRNNVKSEKRALALLPILMQTIYDKNNTINTPNSVDDVMRAKYQGTQFMALV